MSKVDLKQKLLILFFLSLPFVDLLTSLSTRFINSSITIGIIVKGLSLLFALIYVFGFSQCKYRKPTIIYVICVCFFAVLYFLTKPDIWSLSSIITEIIYAFKYLYFPLMTVCLYNVFHDFKINEHIIKHILLIDCMVYALLLLIPYFTNTGFSSYEWNFDGNTGWFYAANEIGAILVILSIVVYDLMDNNKKWKLLLTIPIIFALSTIGTKVSFLGMIISVLFAIIIFVLHNKTNRFGLPIALLVILIACCISSTTIDNMNTLAQLEVLPDTPIADTDSNEHVDSSESIGSSEIVDSSENIGSSEIVDSSENIGSSEIVDSPEPNTPPEIPISPIELIRENKLLNVLNRVLNNRLLYFIENWNIYIDAGFSTTLFGLGWAQRTVIEYTYYKKIIEIDFLDILLHYGLVGFSIYFAPFVYLIYKLIRNIKKIKLESYAYLSAVILGIGVSLIAGHVLGAPSVSIYLILLILLVIQQNKSQNLD